MAFKWQHPEWLWLGPALFVAVLLAAWLFHRWRLKTWRTLGIQVDSKNHTATPMATARFFTRHSLLAIALLLFGFSLANLQMGGQKQKVNRKGADVVFALDVSRSMLAEDIAPSRLEKARLLISRTVDQLGGDRVGIIAYAGSAYPALPITTDYAAAKMALSNASPESVPSQGTNLGAALEYAYGYFNPASPAGRFVIVLTDGEDHESEILNPDSDLPVNIMLVGLGTTSGGPIPLSRDARGVSYKKDNSGEVVITKRDEGQLAKIGASLNANYVDGNRTETALKSIQDFIEGGDKAELQEEIAMDYDSQFSWFLLPGLFFLLLYLSLPARIQWRSKSLLLILFIPSFLNAQEAPARDNEYRFQKSMSAGEKAKEGGDLSTAALNFAEALERKPEAFEPYYNLGTTLLEAGEVEAAEQALGRAMELAKDPIQKSNALYNLGNLQFKNEQYDQAVKSYVQSLAANPEQKDAIYNLNRALEKRKQQQQQEKSQDQDDPKDQKDKQDQKDPPKNQDDQEQQEKEDQDNSKKDQEQNSGQDNQGEQNQEEKEGDGEQSKNQPKEGGEAKAKMTPEEIKGLLEAIQRAEEKTAEKVTTKNAKGKKKSGEKDW